LPAAGRRGIASFGGAKQQQTPRLQIAGRQQLLRPPEETCDFIGIDFPHRRLRARDARRSWGCQGLLLCWRWRGGGPEAAAAALADTSTVPTGVADIQVSRTRLLTSAAPSAPRSSAVKFITPTKSAGGTIDASEISCAGTRHSLVLIRLPTVSLAPADIHDCDRHAGSGRVDADAERQRLIDGSAAVADHQRRSRLALRRRKQG